MSDAKRILAEARATLTRLQGIESAFAEQNARRDPYTPLERTPPVRQNHDAQWDTWCRGIVEEVVGELAEECGGAVGELERALEALRDELAELRASLEVERTVKSNAIVDLPGWRARDAA
jgi:hypothetical protein